MNDISGFYVNIDIKNTVFFVLLNFLEHSELKSKTENINRKNVTEN